MPTIQLKFNQYLIQEVKVSSNTLKFYRSDLNYFTEWFLAKIKTLGPLVDTLGSAIPYLSAKLANEYKNHLVLENKARKTINRKLSSLRSFARFLLEAGYLDYDFTKNLTNITSSGKLQENKSPFTALVNDFGASLLKEQISKNTIKNYRSDIKHFLNWLEKDARTL